MLTSELFISDVGSSKKFGLQISFPNAEGQFGGENYFLSMILNPLSLVLLSSRVSKLLRSST